jgi:hypothetical protein
MGPSGVCCQSCARMRSPSSPPPVAIALKRLSASQERSGPGGRGIGAAASGGPRFSSAPASLLLPTGLSEPMDPLVLADPSASMGAS